MPSPESTNCTPRKGNFCTGAAAAASEQVAGACRSAPDSGAVIGTGVAVEGEEAIILDTKFVESATVSVEGRAKQTNREIAGLI